MSRFSSVAYLALFDARQVLFVGQRVPRNPFCSLVLSGAVVGAPGADNLKIRPEFSPGGVPSMHIFKPSFPREAGIHTAITISEAG